MTRITKTIAQDVAKKLVEKQQADLEALNKSFKDLLYKKLLEEIPQEVMECFKKHKNHFQQHQTISLKGNGFNYERFTMKESLPIVQAYFYPDVETSKVLISAYRDIQKKEIQIEDNSRLFINALMNCRTYENVKKLLPEAEQYLPKPTVTTVAINYDVIRNLIKKLLNHEIRLFKSICYARFILRITGI